MHPHRSTLRTLSLLFVLLSLCTASPALAAPGDLDTSFGTDGVTTFGMNGAGGETTDWDYGSAVAMQEDGKLLIAENYSYESYIKSRFAIRRLNADGTPDTTFSTDGLAEADPHANNTGTNYSVAPTPNGGAIACGMARPAGHPVLVFTLVAFAADGSVASSFGTSGIAEIRSNNLPNPDTTRTICLDVAVQSDGKILALGTRARSGGGEQSIIARFLPNGTLDSTYGTGGILLINGNPRPALLYRWIELLADGTLLAGIDSPAATGPDYAVARILPNGTLDSSFVDADSGRVGVVSIPNDASGSVALAGPDVGVQSSGKVIAAVPTTAGMRVHRINANGSIDPTFGTAGTVIVADIPSTSSATEYPNYAVVVDDDDRIIITGKSGTAAHMAVARLSVDGVLDTSFGTDGVMSSNVGGMTAGNFAVPLPDSSIIITGGAKSSENIPMTFVAKIVGADEVTETLPPDLCTNIGLSQEAVPTGMQRGADGTCKGGSTPIEFTGSSLRDIITGSSAADVLSGGGGNDVINGGRGNDVISGGAGNDTITGGPGRDRVDAGPGNDTIILADNIPGDVVVCGKGRDRAVIDRGDTARGCEKVKRKKRR